MARRSGVRVREETLLREVGYRVRSGSCRVRGEEVIFLDRHADARASACRSCSDALGDARPRDRTTSLRRSARLLERRRGARSEAARHVGARPHAAVRAGAARTRAQVDVAARRHRASLLRRRVSTSRSRSSTPRSAGEPAGRLRDGLPDAQAAQGVRPGRRAPLRRRPGALRGQPRRKSSTTTTSSASAAARSSSSRARSSSSLQERIARFLGFVVSRHRMELYGICAECREGRPAQGKRERGIQHV